MRTITLTDEQAQGLVNMMDAAVKATGLQSARLAADLLEILQAAPHEKEEQHG